MMKTYLKRAFQLSDSGVKGLAKSIWSFFLYYVSFVPPMICVFLFADRLLNGNTGKPVVYLLFMLAATLVMYLVINYNYKTTYDETYQESANLRIDLAEQLSKLPLSYFSKHNLSDLAQTIMADSAPPTAPASGGWPDDQLHRYRDRAERYRAAALAPISELPAEWMCRSRPHSCATASFPDKE